MTRLAPLLTVLAALLLPATALASSVSVVDGQLRYVAEAGYLNSVQIELVEGDRYQVRENDASPPDRTPLTPGPGCSGNGNQVDCPAAGVTSISVALGDRDDDLQVGRLPVPMSLSGGPGTDRFGYVLYPESQPLTITADGQADDGPAGRDDIGTDVETIRGDAFADTLLIGPGGGGLTGGAGDDRLTGGAGHDIVGAAYVEDVGLDSGSFYPEGTDTIRCGGGRDLVYADGTDQVDRDCEVVGRFVEGRFRFTGSHGADRINPSGAWAPADIYGRGGGDLIIVPGFGQASVYGGAGADRIQGSNNPDRLEGGSGNDRIRARETTHPLRDVVRCGPGRDTAIVDRRDSVSGCERVLRSR